MADKQYMCLLRSEPGACQEPLSPSDMEAVYAKYRQWQEKFECNIVDMGNKLGEVGAVVSADKVTDGPYIELKELIGGYMTIKAETTEEAVNVIKNSPMLENPGVNIEIREIATP